MSIKLMVFDMAATTVKDDYEVRKASQAALKRSKYIVQSGLVDSLMAYQ